MSAQQHVDYGHQNLAAFECILWPNLRHRRKPSLCIGSKNLHSPKYSRRRVDIVLSGPNIPASHRHRKVYNWTNTLTIYNHLDHSQTTSLSQQRMRQTNKVMPTPFVYDTPHPSTLSHKHPHTHFTQSTIYQCVCVCHTHLSTIYGMSPFFITIVKRRSNIGYITYIQTDIGIIIIETL